MDHNINFEVPENDSDQVFGTVSSNTSDNIALTSRRPRHVLASRGRPLDDQYEFY